jgi:hypothetical protein
MYDLRARADVIGEGIFADYTPGSAVTHLPKRGKGLCRHLSPTEFLPEGSSHIPGTLHLCAPAT